MYYKKRLMVTVLLALAGFAALQIPFSYLIGGETSRFSLFDLVAPSLGAFAGSLVGAVTVVVIKTVDVVAHNGTFDTTTIIRLFPLAAAALYFGLRRYRWTLAVIPAAAIILFNLHPEGRQAWYYSLYWLIPIASLFARDSLFFKSLGATFTAHAIGGVAFIYAFNLPATVWIALIPIVFIERMLFTAGGTLTYLAVNSLLSWVYGKTAWPVLRKLVRSEYVVSREFFRKYA